MSAKFDVKAKFQGIERAAIFILSLPEEMASKIISRLSSDEVKELSHAMSNLGVVESNYVEQLHVGFVNELVNTESLVGSFETTERLLSRIFSKKEADQIMSEIRGPTGRSLWDKLSNINEEVLGNFLKNEYPQTIAVVLSRIKAEKSARILCNLPENIADDVIYRMLKMETVHDEVLEEIENILHKEFMNNVGYAGTHDVYGTVASIFNYLDKTSETRLLQSLDERNQEAAEKVRSLMFTFDDLIELDPNSMQVLLNHVDRSKLALALKGASGKVRSVFLASMSMRSSKLLQDEMVSKGLVRIRDVEAAQYEIVNTAKELAAMDEIHIPSNRKEGTELIG